MSRHPQPTSNAVGKVHHFSPEPVIEIENLVVRYGKGDKAYTAVNGLDLVVNEGETVGFIGPNGAGKSTTIKTLMGFTFPTSGTAKVFGADAGSLEARARIGFLPEVALYYPFMKAREVLELYGGLCGMTKKQLRERIPGLLESVGLGGKSETLIKKFSKGMQQRVGIAQAIISNPDLLILDELSSGLDPVGRHDLRETMLDLKRRGKTILFSSHELHEVEDLCDRVVMINQGQKVADENVNDLMAKLKTARRQGRRAEDKHAPQTLEEYFMQLVRPLGSGASPEGRAEELVQSVPHAAG